MYLPMELSSTHDEQHYWPRGKMLCIQNNKKVDRLQALQGFQLFRQSGSFAFVINNGLCSTHSLLLPKKREKI